MEDDAQWEASITNAARELAQLLTWARAERVVRADDDEHVAWLDAMLSGLDPLVEGVGDVQTSIAMRRVIGLHGGRGPWQVDDLAAMTGRDADSVRRVLADLTAAGLAWSIPDSPDELT